jgi:hypothetical protein
MKLLVSAEIPPEDATTNYSFRLGFKYRHRSGDFDSSGSRKSGSAVASIATAAASMTARNSRR